MTVKSPGGIDLRYRFTSVADAMAANVSEGTSWTLIGPDGAPLVGGISDGTGIYPGRMGVPIPTSMLEEDPDYGYEILSGTVVPVLSAIGTGYVPTEVVTMDGGTIDFGGVTIGVRMSVVVDTVDGGGGITTWTQSAGTAGFGDYLYLPTLDTAISSTASAAGTGATFVLSQDATGVSRDGDNLIVVEPHRSAGTPSCVLLRLGLVNGGASTGWWDWLRLSLHIDIGTQTQVSTSADAELSTFFGLRIERVGDIGNEKASNVGLQTSGGSAWKALTQRMSDLVQSVGTASPIVSGSSRHIAMYREVNSTGDTPIMSVELDDANAASKARPVGSAGISALSEGWTYTSDTSEADDLAVLYAIFYAGPTAGDQQQYTIRSLRAVTGGRALR